ncbi:MAG: methionyl-tRNA formyltransferase [Thermodesulfobacteriota bacterium]
MRESWRIIFFGTPAFAIPTLSSLMKGPDEVVAVVTQPDREKGRGRKVIPSPVKELALQYKIPVFQPEKVKDENFYESLRAFQPDLMIVVAYGQILPKSVLDIPKYGAINVHASLLPKYRGASPIAWAILKGEKRTGVTTIKMDEGMDTGDILLQKAIAIGETENFESLHDRLALLGAEILMETLEKMKKGDLTPIPQDHSEATFAPSFKKEDGRIDWKREAKEIDCQIRALNPWPGAFTEWNGRLLKIFSGEIRQGRSKGEAGKVVWVASDFIEVETGNGFYLIKEVQLEGKRRMSVREFLPGHPIPVGTVFQ